MPEKFDVLIIGAGPAGLSTALKLAKSGLKIAIFDKAVFPREKTCGDGLTFDVINQLADVSESLNEAFKQFPKKQESREAMMFSPDFSRMSIPLQYGQLGQPFYTCRRIDFDHLMFQQLKQHKNISVFENCKVQKVEIKDERVLLTANDSFFEGSMLVGSDGANSMFFRAMKINRIQKEHQAVGLTTYYSGLEPLNQNNPIELYFLKDLLPYYLWIFHLPGGMANVGICMLASAISKQKVNFNQMFEDLLASEPFKSRFLNAKRESKVKGHMLPSGFNKRTISGNRFLLAGDAASLIDPFTGEGVGNAIRSGRVAAEHIADCFRENDFSADFNKKYDDEIYRRRLPEYKMNHVFRNLCRYPWLLNYVFGSVDRYPDLEKKLNLAFFELQSNTVKSKIVFIYKTLAIFSIQRLIVSVFGKKRT
jgi:geranylgeranyl reductase family protein